MRRTCVALALLSFSKSEVAHVVGDHHEVGGRLRGATELENTATHNDTADGILQGSESWNLACVVGQIQSSRSALAFANRNSVTACARLCAQTNGCAAFDVTTNSQSDSCRLAPYGQTPRLGYGGIHHRQYCTLELAQPAPTPPPPTPPPPTSRPPTPPQPRRRRAYVPRRRRQPQQNGPNSCRYAFDGQCDEPRYCEFGTDSADCQHWRNSCRWALDGVCDEPNVCPVGTDTSDCWARRDSCRWANDGVCDEPGLCPEGTDSSDCLTIRFRNVAKTSEANHAQSCEDLGSHNGTEGKHLCDTIPLGADCKTLTETMGATEAMQEKIQKTCQRTCGMCGGSQEDTRPSVNKTSIGTIVSSQTNGPSIAHGAGPNSCRFAFDGACDEPGLCDVGTDTADCQAWHNSCPWALDGVCDEPNLCRVGTDSSDCYERRNSCRWAHDGQCDEPALCAEGTDFADCHHFYAYACKDVIFSNATEGSQLCNTIHVGADCTTLTKTTGVTEGVQQKIQKACRSTCGLCQEPQVNPDLATKLKLVNNSHTASNRSGISR